MLFSGLCVAVYLVLVVVSLLVWWVICVVLVFCALYLIGFRVSLLACVVLIYWFLVGLNVVWVSCLGVCLVWLAWWWLLGECCQSLALSGIIEFLPVFGGGGVALHCPLPWSYWMSGSWSVLSCGREVFIAMLVGVVGRWVGWMVGLSFCVVLVVSGLEVIVLGVLIGAN